VRLVLTNQPSGPETRVLELSISHVITEASLLSDEVVSTVAAGITATTIDTASTANTNSKFTQQFRSGRAECHVTLSHAFWNRRIRRLPHLCVRRRLPALRFSPFRDLDEIKGSSEFRCDFMEFFGETRRSQWASSKPSCVLPGLVAVD